MQTHFGRYRLDRHLATGGMGEVYLAEAVGAAGFSKRLVIKTLRADLAADERLVERFVAEGRLLEALDHPGIAQILDLGIADETYFLAMEYVEGFDLRELRRALPAVVSDVQDPLPAALGEVPVLCVLVTVAEALDHAQTRSGPDGMPLRIVHHDVTPSNIMVRPDGRVKLVDFGVAHAAVWGRMSEGALRGKLPYLSPEQARREPVDGRADIFALGLVAIELLGGARVLDVADADGLATAYPTIAGRIDTLARRGVQAPTLALLRDMVALERGARCSAAFEVAERARERLLHLGEASLERPLANALAPAFAELSRRAGGFDATLAGMVGAGQAVAGLGEASLEGTVSLPGLMPLAGLVQTGTPTPFSALSQPGSTDPDLVGPPTVRLRKRVVFGLLTALLLVGALGWWLGSRQPPVNAPLTADPALVAASAKPPSDRVAANVGEATDPNTRPSRAPDARSQPAPPRAVTPTAVAPQPTVVPAAVTAIASPQPPAPVAQTRIRRPAARQAHKRGTLVFLVLPADAAVLIDGKAVTASKTGRYRLRLPIGPHTVKVRDRHSGVSKERSITLKADRTLRLPGFALLPGMP